MSTAPVRSHGDAFPRRVFDVDALLIAHDRYLEGLPSAVQAKYLRRRGAGALLAAHPDLDSWMSRPAGDRIAEARRLYAWPFLSWCFATGRLIPDLELLAGKGKGHHYVIWAAFHRADVDQAAAVCAELGWVPEWVHRVSVNALAIVCLTQQVTLSEITTAELQAVSVQIRDSALLEQRTRRMLRGQHHSLRKVCYQLGLLAEPPAHANARPWQVDAYLDQVLQPQIRRAFGHYLRTVSTTLRPKTVQGRAASLVLFAGWLAQDYPEVQTLSAVTRDHMEHFLAYDADRPCRGRLAGPGRTVSPGHHGRTVRDLKAFFEDLAVWQWSDRPTGLVLHRGDLPRLPAPLPRSLPPDVDTALMRAVHNLDDAAARTGILLLRGTGLRLGELLDLELDCLWDLPGHGSWLKVPLGKLNTERVVPLDQTTLDALDEWMALRGQQRALPHPRTGRPTDFLFAVGGTRIGPTRIRKGLQIATRDAQLADRCGQPLHITPHQLRHTYATSLVNAGMSLQALMALLGHVTPEMTLRYANLANTTVRQAYDTAMARLGTTHQLPLTVATATSIPNRLEWLHAEMIKTRLGQGYCTRHPAAGPCQYANICEQCESFHTAPEFTPLIRAQLDDEVILRDDAQARNWPAEATRHARVITALERHIKTPDPEHPLSTTG